MKLKVTLLLGLLMSFPYLVTAEDRSALNKEEPLRARMGTVRDEARFNKIIDLSAEIYSSTIKGKQGEVPARLLKNTQCIAVIPDVMTGALIVGGSHRNGVVSCKDAMNGWSQPAAISFNQGSIGLQAGAKSADLVLFVQSKEAVQALKRGKFALGADVSAVAGNYDSNIDTSTAGVVVYSRAEGLFAGASVSGGTIGKNDDDIASYYGSKVDFAAILERRESPDTAGYSEKLTRLFP